MPSIGSVQFDFMSGAPMVQPKASAQVIARPGIDGEAIIKSGKRSQDGAVVKQCIHYADDDAAAETHRGTVGALQHTYQTVVDEFAHSYTNVWVIAVQAVSENQAEAFGSVTGSKRRLVYSITMARTE